MSMKVLRKIDRFYVVLSGVLIVLAAPLIYTGLGIFQALITASEVDTSLQRDARVDKTRVDKAISETFEKEIKPIEVRETYLVVPVNESNEE